MLINKIILSKLTLKLISNKLLNFWFLVKGMEGFLMVSIKAMWLAKILVLNKLYKKKLQAKIKENKEKIIKFLSKVFNIKTVLLFCIKI
jgi:hypothetical protein